MTASLTRSLIDVCMGRRPADMVIRKGNWVCVQSSEFVPDTDIAIKNGYIAYVGPDAAYTIAKNTQVIDAEGKYLVPGLLDGHMHVESGMVTVTEFVRAVLPHGTTSMFIDPHEMANVFGLKGVKLMTDEAARQPSHVWVQMPSCVPSYPGLETPGGEITSKDVAKAMRWDNIIGLGEMMNYRAVAAASPAMLAEMETTLKTGKVVGGHYASPDLGPAFHAYAAGGPEDDHEGTRIEDAVARARQGMWVMLRSGSAWKDVAAQVAAITRLGLASNRFILCTDDSHAGTLVYEGHMDRVVREAIAEGLPPMTAIQMATINTAEHFGVSREVGMIAPGRWADILLVKDLEKFQAEWVLCRGRMAAKNSQLLLALPKTTYPAWATHSIHIKRPLTAGDFRLRVSGDLADAKAVRVNVIEIIENCAPTNHKQAVVPVKDGEIQLQPGLAKLALVERHHKTGTIQQGLVSGFGFTQPCGIASSVAHDSHHLLVAGTSETDMALAVNKLAEIGGGQVVVMKGKILGQVELTIGGLMSTEKAPRVAQKVSRLLEGFRACGCTLNNANSTLSLLALVVIPELRLSDKGLVDAVSSSFIPLVDSVVG